jgi:N-acetyl-gamma-glutamyl-phosphate reductase
MGIRVAVAGASGYAGGELLRLLAGHPHLEPGVVTGASQAGAPVTDVHPNLVGHPSFEGRVFKETTAELLRDAELIFMALPHGQSAALARELPHARIVDLSADFRLGDKEAWDHFYGVPYAGQWTYGLPELRGARDKIAASRTVAVPGCYPTTAILGLAPLLDRGLAEPDDIVIVAASGASGSGRTPRPDLLASEVMGSMSAYQAGGTHRHTPEIEQALTGVIREVEPRSARAVTISFTPMLAPMPRGLLATCTAKLSPGVADSAQLQAAIRDYYKDSPFVRLLRSGQWPVTQAVSGSNGAHIQVAADGHAGRAVVVAATDNLGKGAAGQAVQIANIMLGLPETAGLTPHGVSP